ncbi:hypothetical protein LCGC14_1724340 [marine sediment metagenome]|uniref:Uncharacterized protein n=1 Tax=marine sediment metagenome TaxID=412755 RepID=A0A0F9JS16_9ZZZZ
MYLSYEQVAATNVVKTVVALTVPGNATMVELQADTQDVRFTMDDTTDPTQTSGMIMLVSLPKNMYLIEDLQRIRFVRGAGTDANLNLHYSAGRDI